MGWIPSWFLNWLGKTKFPAEPIKIKPMQYGIDVSHHNGVIDWQKVKANGILAVEGSKRVDFAYIKVTEGASGRDKKAGYNAAECYRVGLPWGPYHFCTLNRKDEVADATEEANYLIKRLTDLPPYQMPIALDVELETQGVSLTDEEIEAWVKTFFAVLTAAGHNNYILYSYSPFLREHLPQNHSLWHIRLWAARYSTNLPLPVQGWGQKFWMWQYSNIGKVSGITGNVDLNKIL